MLSDALIQTVRECGSNVKRNRDGKQNQKRTVRHIRDHRRGGHGPAGMGSSDCRIGRSWNRLGLSSLEKLRQNRMPASQAGFVAKIESLTRIQECALIGQGFTIYHGNSTGGHTPGTYKKHFVFLLGNFREQLYCSVNCRSVSPSQRGKQRRNSPPYYSLLTR
jgi:hypothetical protein